MPMLYWIMNSFENIYIYIYMKQGSDLLKMTQILSLEKIIFSYRHEEFSGHRGRRWSCYIKYSEPKVKQQISHIVLGKLEMSGRKWI